MCTCGYKLLACEEAPRRFYIAFSNNRMFYCTIPPDAHSENLTKGVHVLQVAANPSRVAARILHGLSSPEYPAKAWSNCGFWGRYSDVAFSTVLRIAQRLSRS